MTKSQKQVMRNLRKNLERVHQNTRFLLKDPYELATQVQPTAAMKKMP